MQNNSSGAPSLPDQTSPEGLAFQATLLPHRSLARKGFIALMCAVIAVSFVGGAVFMAMGAWPVTGFFGLDVLLVYVAFRINYRDARLRETIELRESELHVTRVLPSGKAERWTFNPYWVRFRLTPRENATAELAISSHGKTLVFGEFLADSEKESFAAAFSDALRLQAH